MKIYPLKIFSFCKLTVQKFINVVIKGTMQRDLASPIIQNVCQQRMP